jgi:hypothetical protein
VSVYLANIAALATVVAAVTGIAATPAGKIVGKYLSRLVGSPEHWLRGIVQEEEEIQPLQNAVEATNARIDALEPPKSS